MLNSFLENFIKIEKAYRKFFQSEMEKYQFTPNEVLVLLFLGRGESEHNTAKDIAQFEGVSKGLVARSVEGLTEKGYLTLKRDDSDKRIVHLYLTENCKEVVAEISGKQELFFEKMLQNVPQEYVEITRETMELFIKNIES